MEKLQIHLYEWKNNKFSQIAIIDDYQEYSFEHNLFQAGQFTITINFNIPNAQKFKKGLFVRIGESDYDFGEITRINDTLGENGKGSQIRNIIGYDARYILKRRVIKNMNDGGKWSMTDKGELCLRNLINDQCGSNAESKRQLPILNTIPTHQNAIGKDYSVSEEFSNLYEVCKTIAIQSEIGWRMKFNSTNLILECYTGNDIHTSVFFSPDFDSLANGQFSDSTDAFSNAIYVAGKGQNEERDLYEGETLNEDEETPEGLDRFECFDNQSEMTTEEEYEAEAHSMLAQYGQTIEMSGNGLVKCPYVFREQYDIGDKITLSFNDQKAVVQIQSVTERSAKGVYSINFKFGKPENALSDQLQIILRKLQMASNKTNAVDSVKWYEIPTDTEMSPSDVTFNTIGFTGDNSNTDFTFTLYRDDEQTGSKNYWVYIKNLIGTGKLILTSGVEDTETLSLNGGTYVASIYVDKEGNVKLNSATPTDVIESGNPLPPSSDAVYNAIGGGGSSGGVPVGSIVAMYSENPPSDNWLLCDGSTFDADEYPALYMYLGTNVLPDLRNKAIMGANPDVAGKADGNTSNLGDVQKAQLPNIKGIINAQPSGTAETLASHTADGAFIPDFTRQRSIDSGTSSSSAYRCWKNFDASLNGEQDYPNNVKVNHYASKDHLGDNVYYGNFDCQTGEVTTAGETRPANIRLNYFIKAVTSSSDSDYQGTLAQIEQYVEERANRGIPLGTFLGFENDTAPNEDWLESGTTFDPDTYPALAMMLGGNTVPERFDRNRPSDYESFTINNTNTLVPYDGIINIQGALSWSQIYVNDVLIGLTTDTSQKASDCTIYVKKGDYVRWGNAVVQNAYARWFKHHLFIKAVPSSTNKDYEGTLASFRTYILNQNKLSDYEEITLSTTNLQVDYDGLITVNMYASSGVYVNDVQVASIRDTSGTPNSTTIPVNKGDNIKISGTFRFAYARWYKQRDYS